MLNHIYHKENKMKIFDSNNPKHFKILLEELRRAKNLLNEGSHFNADEIWADMPESDREHALLAVTGNNGSDLVNTYISNEWDQIPSNIQDSIDLSEYQLANDDKDGRIYLNGIKYMIKNRPEHATVIQKLIKKYCTDSANRTFEKLTSSQARELNLKVMKLVNQLSGTTTNKPASAGIGSMIDADKASGKYHRGSLGD